MSRRLLMSWASIQDRFRAAWSAFRCGVTDRELLLEAETERLRDENVRLRADCGFYAVIAGERLS